MKISEVRAVYSSPTGNVKKTVCMIAGHMAEVLGVPVSTDDFTLPPARTGKRCIPSDVLTVFGMPVYAGRVPNRMAPYINRLFNSDGAPAVPVVCFGNRSFGDALSELRDELEASGFRTAAAAAVVTGHVFTERLAHGRPDEEDRKEILDFAYRAALRIRGSSPDPSEGPVAVDGSSPPGPYYRPLGTDGKPAHFLKASPVTDMQLCTRCGLCARICPPGSISNEDPSLMSGICIKCHACILGCPAHARHFEDRAFLSHVKMLEQNFTDRARNRFYL